MTANELRRLFIDFFVNNYEHKEISGASLLPENDPTVLFTTAGMHPLVPYLLGEKHACGTRLVDVQKCIRTDDIEEVGDNTHLTFFEMLGNWSLGDFFKEEAIKMSYDFLTRPREEGGLGLDPARLAVSCFAGDDDAPRDEEAAKVWESLGFKRLAEDAVMDPDKMEAGNIYFFDKKENWWGPAGQTGPCGPDTEIFYITDEGEAVEIWNDVFMQYNKNADGSFTPLEQQNVDTGMGLERVMAIMNGVKSPFETSLFMPLIEELRTLAGYGRPTEEQAFSERVIADHVRAATFILGDDRGVSPSNTDQGYVLRRLIRRAIGHGRKLGIETDFVRKLAGVIVKEYGEFYQELQRNQERIYEEIVREEEQFLETVSKGMQVLGKELEGLNERVDDGVKALPEDFVFQMHATYGFPMEMTLEELTSAGWIQSEEDEQYLRTRFEKQFKEHQEKSRAGAEQKFSGGLADHSYETTRLHTATHLLHQALKDVLGDHVEQRGSNITKDRLRFDFNHEEKMTKEEIAAVEKIVNEQIKEGLPVSCEEMTVEEAKERGAIGLFESKYGEKVKVYFMGDKNGEKRPFSVEICGGPHVENTGELKNFRIKKEESSSRGVRRIKAIVDFE